MKREHALQYHPYVIPERTDLKDAIAFTCGASLGHNNELFETDESDPSGDFCNEWEQDGTNSNSKSDPGILHSILAMWGLLRLDWKLGSTISLHEKFCICTVLLLKII